MYSCVTPGCKRAAIFDTNVCEDCLAKQCQKSPDNTAPEFFICRPCEVLCGRKEFEKHFFCEEVEDED